MIKGISSGKTILVSLETFSKNSLLTEDESPVLLPPPLMLNCDTSLMPCVATSKISTSSFSTTISPERALLPDEIASLIRDESDFERPPSRVNSMSSPEEMTWVWWLPMSILASLMMPCTLRLSVNGWNAVSEHSRTIHIGFLSALFALPSSFVPVVESLRCDSMPTKQPVPQTCDRTQRSSSLSTLSLRPSSSLLTRRIASSSSTLDEATLLKPSSPIIGCEGHGWS